MFLEPVPPRSNGWKPDINLFGEAEVVDKGDKERREGYCSWEETDSDLGTPEGSDEEFMNIVGSRWKQKKQREEEFNKLFVTFRMKEKNAAQSSDVEGNDVGNSTLNYSRSQNHKKRTARRNVSLADDCTLHEKHTAKNRSWGRDRLTSSEGRATDGDGYDSDLNRMEFCDGSFYGGSDEHEDSDSSAANRGKKKATATQKMAKQKATAGAKRKGKQPVDAKANKRTKEKVAAEAKRKGKQKACAEPSNVSAADKKAERRKRAAEAVRRYKILDINLECRAGATKFVPSDIGNDFGEKPLFEGHGIGGFDDYMGSSSSSSEDEVITIPVQSDPRSTGSTNIWFNEEWEIPYFQVGMRFIDYNQFKRDIQKYAVKTVCGIKAVRNEPMRQRYKCKDGCKWLTHASPDSRINCFRVKKYYWVHNCTEEPRNKRCTSKYIADLYREIIQQDPSYTCKDMMIEMLRDRGISVRFSKCVRAKVLILTELEGNFIFQYGVVVGYANYLKSVNPNNTVVVVADRKTRMRDSPSVFSRMYVCLAVLKEGFKKGCRKVIGIDGTFLKGVCKGVLFTAVSKDGNGQMYPIAWAVVDGESHETWSWFIRLLIKDFDLGKGDNYTIISDKHKGIISARNQYLPNAEVRFCSRHL